MAERETKRGRQERIRQERRIGLQQARGRQRWQRVLVAAGAALVIAVGGGYGIYQFLQSEEQVEVVSSDLGLKIDEAGFLRAVREGPRLGIITETWDRNKMDCLEPLGDFCISEASPNFKVAINRPMTDFMFKQSDLLNLPLPTRMVIAEDWLEKVKEEHTGGYTAIADDGSDQIIVVSLKVAALKAFQDLENRKLPLEDYFDGAVSYMLSEMSAHEFGHAGAQTRKMLQPNTSLSPDDFLNLTHPQIFSFHQRYADLYNQAYSQGLGQGALILAVNVESTVNLREYRQQIMDQAKGLGLIN